MEFKFINNLSRLRLNVKTIIKKEPKTTFKKTRKRLRKIKKIILRLKHIRILFNIKEKKNT